MLIGIEAKFKRIEEAKRASELIGNEVRVDLLQVLTVSNLPKFKEVDRDQSMRKGLMSMTAIGGIIGGLCGATLDFIIKFYSIVENYQKFYQSAFIICGLIVGMMSATLLYFIHRENITPISVEDIKRDEALLIIKVPRRDLDDVLVLLEDMNAKSIHTT